ncbi:hypothetical protein ACFWFZ_05220 [Streptomyces sp. NPDC060232]
MANPPPGDRIGRRKLLLLLLIDATAFALGSMLSGVMLNHFSWGSVS